MNKTFGNILLLQRIIFFVFVLCIPVLSRNGNLLVWLFLFFWSVFNFFVGCYNVFYTPLVIKLLPPDKRGTVRGIGNAAGSLLGLGAAALIPFMLGRISFPYNYTAVFLLGTLLLLIDGAIFLFMRQHEHVVPNTQMSTLQFLSEMSFAVRKNVPFRTLIFTCMFLAAANALIPYYTLYAIKIFSATESVIAALAATSVLSNAVGYVGIGALIDRYGPKTTSLIAAVLVITAGTLALFSGSIIFLFAAWVFANLANSSYMTTVLLLLGEVSPPSKLPLYVSVQTMISLALSSAVLLLLAPVLENAGFTLLFAVVLLCGVFSLLLNLFVLRKKLKHINPHKN